MSLSKIHITLFEIHKNVMHIVGTLIQRSCIFYDLHKIVVWIFEALTVGSNAHTAKQIKHICRT